MLNTQVASPVVGCQSVTHILPKCATTIPTTLSRNSRNWRMQRGCTHGCTTRSALRCAPAESNESPRLRQSEGQECLHSAQQCARSPPPMSALGCAVEDRNYSHLFNCALVRALLRHRVRHLNDVAHAILLDLRGQACRRFAPQWFWSRAPWRSAARAAVARSAVACTTDEAETSKTYSSVSSMMLS